MTVTAGEGLSVHGRFTVTDDHQGAPGLALVSPHRTVMVRPHDPDARETGAHRANSHSASAFGVERVSV